MDISITLDELYKMNENEYILVDTRSERDYSYGSIGNAVHYYHYELKDKLDKDKFYVIFAVNDKTSESLTVSLIDDGFNVKFLVGGYNALVIDDIKKSIGTDKGINAERSLQTTYRKDILSQFMKAIKDYQLIKPNDKIAVCISGGKDSMLMALLFKQLQRYTKIPFEVEYMVMDPGYNKLNREVIEKNAELLQIPVKIFESDIFDTVYNVEKTPCYLCARMRRGCLYSLAKELGCNKIALGHHYDDVIETILMGMLYGAQVQSMMPKLHSTNFEGMELIRPLYLIREDDIKRWRNANGLHFIQCACKFTENSNANDNEDGQSKRLETKMLIKELKKTNPEVESHIFKSVENVSLDTVIAYKSKGVVHHFLDDYDK